MSTEYCPHKDPSGRCDRDLVVIEDISSSFRLMSTELPEDYYTDSIRVEFVRSLVSGRLA